MTIEQAITKTRARLDRQAKTRGLSENFGQVHLRELENRFVDSNDNSLEMNKIRKAIADFRTEVAEWEV